jgi:hypothetical protein
LAWWRMAGLSDRKGSVVDDDPVVVAAFAVLRLAVAVVELGGHLLGFVPFVEPVRELNVVEGGALRRLRMPPAAKALVL